MKPHTTTTATNNSSSTQHAQHQQQQPRGPPFASGYNVNAPGFQPQYGQFPPPQQQFHYQPHYGGPRGHHHHHHHHHAQHQGTFCSAYLCLVGWMGERERELLTVAPV